VVFKLIKKLTGKDIELIKEGDELFERWRYEEALMKYKEALDINPDDIDIVKDKIEKIEKILYLRKEGHKLFSEGKFSEALKAFEEILKINPKDMETKNTIGNIKERAFNYYVELGDKEFINNNYQKAKEFYEKALSFKNKEIENLNKINKILELHAKGKELLEKKDYESALSIFEEILMLNPNDREAKAKVEEIENILSKIEEFKRECESELLNCNYETALNKFMELKKLLPFNKEVDEKIDYLNKIINLINEGNEAFKNNEFDIALRKFEEALKLNPNDKNIEQKIEEIREKAFNYYVGLGDKEFINNNYQKAKEFYEKALSFKNKEIENLNKINKIIPLREEGLELFNDGYYETALARFKEILKIKPDDLEAKEMIDKINKINQLILEVNDLLNKEDYDKAVGKLEEILKLNPNDKKVKSKILEIKGNKAKLEIDNLNLSNYRELYNKYKDVLEENDDVFSYYCEKLIELINELNESENYKLAAEAGLFLMEVRGISDLTNEIVWNHKVKDGVHIMSIEDDIIVLGCSRYAHALNLKTGEELWMFEGNEGLNVMSIKNNVVVLGYKDGYVYALNLKTGDKIWEFKAESGVYAMSVKDNTVVLGCCDGHAYALNLKTGEKLWEFKSEEGINDVSTKNNTVVLGCYKGYVYALNLKTGDKIWEFKAEEHVKIVSIKDDIVVLGCEYYDFRSNQSHGYAYALDIKTGDKIWDIETKGSVLNMLIKDDILILGCHGGYAYVLDVNTGRGILAGKAEENILSMAIKDNVVILGCDYNDDSKYAPVFALDIKTGKRVWRFEADGGVKSMITKYNAVMLGCRNGYLYALEAKTGKRLWRHELRWSVNVASTKQDIVVFGCYDGYTYAFNLTKITLLKPLLTSLTSLIEKTRFLINRRLSFLNLQKAKDYLRLAERELKNRNPRKSYENIRLAERVITEEFAKNVDSLITPTPSIAQKIQRLEKDKEVVHELFKELIKIINQPVDISLNLPKKSFNVNEWVELPVEITNNSIKHIKNLKISIVSEDISFREIEPVEIKGNETKTINIMVRAKAKGNLPVDIVVEFEDVFNNQYEQRFSEVLTITEDLDKLEKYHQKLSEVLTMTITKNLEKKADKTSTKTLRIFPPELKEYYKNVEFIGEGGFARVFKAVRVKDNLPVAIKIPISLDAVTGKLFLRELENWTKLEHPNIVKVYDYNILPIPYFEMELCDESLDELLKRKKVLDVNHACYLIFNIAEGLRYAHSKNIIHKDLKPQNILLKNGIPKISDWGLSRVLTQASVSRVVFTPHYAAPEQFSRKYGDIGVWTDVWQLGVVFYQLVTGELPFKGDDFIELMTAITTKDPIKPSELNPQIDKEVEDIILKCLKKKPEERYQSMSELQRDLAKYLYK